MMGQVAAGWCPEQSREFRGRATRSHLVVSARNDGAPWVALIARTAWSIEPGENVAREPRDTVRLHGDVIAAAPSRTTPTGVTALGAAMRTQQIAGALTRLTEMTRAVRPGPRAVRPAARKISGRAAEPGCVWRGRPRPRSPPPTLQPKRADGSEVLPIAAGKARAGEAAGIAAAIAHQVHGAIGFTLEHNLHFLTRRLWSWRDEFGKDAAWQRLLGRHMAQAGADNLWAEITAA